MDTPDNVRGESASRELFRYADFLRREIADRRITPTEGLTRLVKKIAKGSAPVEAAILRSWGVR